MQKQYVGIWEVSTSLKKVGTWVNTLYMILETPPPFFDPLVDRWVNTEYTVHLSTCCTLLILSFFKKKGRYWNSSNVG